MRTHHTRRSMLKTGLAATGLWGALLAALPMQQAWAQAKVVQTPYQSPKVLFDFYLDHPAKVGSALYWVRSLMNALTSAPYNMFAEDIKAVVLMHGTELVTVAKKNEDKYGEQVQRMRYYAQQGVKFRICGQAMKEYGYTPADLQDFVEVAPSAIPELVYWQNQGYALVRPLIQEKLFSIEDIR
jgi:intracellular sulfur oxidation DsrE/DsrF family protein